MSLKAQTDHMKKGEYRTTLELQQAIELIDKKLQVKLVPIE